MSQTDAGWRVGAYVPTFLAAQRGNLAGNHQTFQVEVDGVVVAAWN